MGRVKDLQIELENLENEFHALIEDLLKKNGYRIHQSEPIQWGFFSFRPDLIVSPPGTRKRIIVGLKLYRSERSSTALLEQSVAHLVSYMQASDIGAGVLVVTSEVSVEQ